MCGITGAINFKNIKENDKEYIAKFNSSIFHRGPDASGMWTDEKVVFGHVRLSIIDLSTGSNQPMLSHDEDIVIVFNGEIYNHEEIKRELKDEFVFKTDHSDTEVIIYAYKKWGIEALQKFTGMFAIALYDKVKEKVYLVRDRFGKKPFYFTTVDDTFYFSSENQAFFESGLIQKEFNDEAIYHYLTFLTVPAPKTFFKNVSKIEAGYYYEVSAEGMSKHKYWDIADYLNTENHCSYSEAKKQTENLLETAMKYRNVADVPISIALSGGLDSSLNLFYTKQNRSDEISTINISYEKTSKFDESVIAEKYSKEMGVKYLPNQISEQDFIGWIEEYLSISKDIPTGDPNTALMYGISKIARENGFKVLLVGEGGDEIGGYPIYDKLVKLDKYMKFIPESLSKFINKLPFPNKIKKKVSSVLENPVYARRFIFGFSENQKTKFWKKNKGYDSYKIIKKISDEINIDSKDSFLRKVLNVEYKLRLAELLLPRVDYPSMAASIEARSPFMDHALVEYSASLPWNIKMKHGAKTIIKDIAKDKLPEYIVNAPKVGFGMLLNPFLQDIMPVWFKNDILDKKAPIKEYIKDEFLEDIYSKHYQSKNYGYQLWIFYSLNKWMVNNG
ncbi:asparagine synthase (glutamine-hydrolyzing) [Aliarcobacter butzleri]|uniref:asparagine synthase (glutamine-hydrolyzing) n=1 Tax=Aliarcobacter butzleri TaxID=28197 RepID=UPI00263D9A3B|nr:asparagine synthase (glutamine-hydrolyzing) [Aliarcobacter butzleri]MDN5045620.1 asparagine synthase (glutamine-hydrolyzing) [Aliarcobacter butzleri]